jgi:hypothetical protein
LNMHIERTCDGYSERARAIFGNRLEGLRDVDLLRVFHGAEWFSVLVCDDHHAWLHVVAPEAVGGTGWHDNFPWWNYGGELLANPSPSFLSDALRLYAAYAPAWRIAADVTRFDPAGVDAAVFAAAGVRVTPVRHIAYVPAAPSASDQLASYRASARRQITRAKRDLSLREVSGDRDGMDEFTRLMHDSFGRVGAGRRWNITERLSGLSGARNVTIWLVSSGSTAWCGALAILDGTVGHCVLVGSRAGHPLGANDLLMHGVIRGLADRGASLICLGGGRTAADSDSLLAFKRKFAASGTTRPLSVGLLFRSPGAMRELLSATGGRPPANRTLPDSVILDLLPHRASATGTPAGDQAWPPTKHAT